MIIASTGPYVLIAVAAFMVGVIVTVTIMRSRKKESGRIEEEQRSEKLNDNGKGDFHHE